MNDLDFCKISKNCQFCKRKTDILRVLSINMTLPAEITMLDYVLDFKIDLFDERLASFGENRCLRLANTKFNPKSGPTSSVVSSARKIQTNVRPMKSSRRSSLMSSSRRAMKVPTKIDH